MTTAPNELRVTYLPRLNGESFHLSFRTPQHIRLRQEATAGQAGHPHPVLSRSTQGISALSTAGSLPTELEARLHLALKAFETKMGFLSIDRSKVTRYRYDEAGNETAQIDALNRANAFAYDGMGRRIQHWMPGSQSEGMAYDLAGNQIYHTNFNGAVITNRYDAMNRLTNQASVNGYNVSYTYTPTGQRAGMTDASGATAYSYDNRDRLALKTVNWNGGPSVSLNYGYDANGNVGIGSSTSNGATRDQFK